MTTPVDVSNFQTTTTRAPSPQAQAPTVPVPATATDHHNDESVEVRAAVARVQADVDAIQDSEVLSVTLDVMAGVMQALAAWNTLPSLFDAMARNQDIDLVHIRKLRDYALALSSRQSDFARSLAPSPLAPQLARDGIEMRARALGDLEALARHGFVDAALLTSFGGNTSYKKVAQDLLGISNLVHSVWPSIDGKTLLTLEDMDAAAKLSTAILQAAALREGPPSSAAEIRSLRDKTYTRFVRTYEEARRATQFLRWAEDDCDQILPSLYAARGSRKRGGDPADDATTAAVVDSASTLPLLPPVAEPTSDRIATSGALSSLIGTAASSAIPKG